MHNRRTESRCRASDKRRRRLGPAPTRPPVWRAQRRAVGGARRRFVRSAMEKTRSAMPGASSVWRDDQAVAGSRDRCVEQAGTSPAAARSRPACERQRVAGRGPRGRPRVGRCGRWPRSSASSRPARQPGRSAAARHSMDARCGERRADARDPPRQHRDPDRGAARLDDALDAQRRAALTSRRHA